MSLRWWVMGKRRYFNAPNRSDGVSYLSKDFKGLQRIDAQIRSQWWPTLNLVVVGTSCTGLSKSEWWMAEEG